VTDGTGPSPKPELPALTKAEVPKAVALAETSLSHPGVGAGCSACGAHSTATSFCTSCGASIGADPLVGKELDERYEVVRGLGAGAMGKVYEVRHLRLSKRFAMKVIHRELTQVPEFVARFEREALSMSKLQHPNCVSVTDFGHAETGELYLVMEFLEGHPLSEFLDKPLPVGTALEITRQILLGLQHAHQAGIVHRDVKPENVMRATTSDGSWQVKVVDFGIAKVPVSGDGKATPLTKAGVVFGTPQYMAPEQALGGEVGERADLYAVGVMLWRMLTGRPLFEIDGHVELLSAKLSQDAPELDKVAPGVFSRSLQDLLRRTLERKPSQRIGSAAEMLEAVTRIQREPGGGLVVPAESGGLPPLLQRVATLPRALSGAYSDWFRCVGRPEPPSWPRRLRDLVTSARGAVVLGTGGGVLLLLLLSVVIFASGSEDAPATRRGTAIVPAPRPGKAAPHDPKARATKRAPVRPEGIALARQLLGQGACRDAAVELRSILARSPQRAEAHYLMGATQFCRKLYAEGLDAYATAIRLNPTYQRDGRILEDVEPLLKSSKLQRAAVEFLANQIGAPAVPLLIRAVTGPQYAARRAAVEALTRLGAASRIDWLTVHIQDLRQAPTCPERGAAVEGLRSLKDPRAVPALRQARDERAGFWRRYRNWCIRKEITRALRELQSLPGAPP